MRGVINFCVKSGAAHPAEIARDSASQHSSTAWSLRTRRRILCENITKKQKKRRGSEKGVLRRLGGFDGRAAVVGARGEAREEECEVGGWMEQGA